MQLEVALYSLLTFMQQLLLCSPVVLIVLKEVEMLITKWEYKIVNVLNKGDVILNQLGEEGWELVAVAGNIAYLKRSKGEFRRVGK